MEELIVIIFLFYFVSYLVEMGMKAFKRIFGNEQDAEGPENLSESKRKTSPVPGMHWPYPYQEKTAKPEKEGVNKIPVRVEAKQKEDPLKKVEELKEGFKELEEKDWVLESERIEERKVINKCKSKLFRLTKEDLTYGIMLSEVLGDPRVRKRWSSRIQRL